jgi:hypothetical protein
MTGGFGHQVYFNLDGNVGPRCPNRPDDVQLVQLGYFAVLRDPSNSAVLTPALRGVFDKIIPGAPYSGAADDPLSAAIRAHEASRGGTADGHVSVIRNPGKYDGKHTYITIALNNAIRDTMPDDFPRIDKHPRCPPLLRAAVLKILTGR